MTYLAPPANTHTHGREGGVEGGREGRGGREGGREEGSDAMQGESVDGGREG